MHVDAGLKIEDSYEIISNHYVNAGTAYDGRQQANVTFTSFIVRPCLITVKLVKAR